MADAPRLLLGLDAGNTLIKAVLFDVAGRQLAESSLDGTSFSPAPGHTERDMEELWANTATVIRSCLDKAGVPPRAVAAIGCAGHGNGLYLLDTNDEPLLAIQSLDGRAASIAEELRSNGNGARLHQLCLQEPWPSQTPTLLAWVKRFVPEVYARTATVFLCKDFVNYRLTGRKVSDISDMSAAGLLRMPERTYDADILEAYGLAEARAMLPDLVSPTEVVGGVTASAAEQTGLEEHTPVVGGLFDVVACALGSGAVLEGQASIVAGTWSINQVISAKAISDPRIFMVSAFADHRFVAIESSATSAANLEWYVREFLERGGHHDDPFGYCNDRVAEITPAPDDPFFHPFLYGSRQGAWMRAGFYGVDGWHREGHLMRALFEGVAFEHRRHIDVLRTAGVRFETAVLSGGGSRSPVWPQMFADILQIPISVATCREAGALGAAIAAGVGAKLFKDLDTGVAAMTRQEREYRPGAAIAAHYQRRYEIYQLLTDAMTPIWSQMAACRQGR